MIASQQESNVKPSMLKNRDITLLTKVCIVKAIVFPVITYGCENLTIKKAEHQRMDAFELWCWRRLLKVPWTSRRSNQSILREINPEYSLERLMLKLKVKVTQSFRTLRNPMDYIVHGILQARILEWVVFPFSRGSSKTRDQTQVSHIASGFFTSWATREAQEYGSG